MNTIKNLHPTNKNGGTTRLPTKFIQRAFLIQTVTVSVTYVVLSQSLTT